MGRTLLVVALASLVACETPDPLSAAAGSRVPSYQHGPPPGSPPYAYTLTSYGGPNDSCYLGTPACGGKVVDGKWYYSTGAYTYGCHSKLKLSANGKCVVVEVVDNGPAAWVEQKAAAQCGGLGYIIDASPLVSSHLYGTTSAGWSDCFAIQVTPVASSTPTGSVACGAEPSSCGDGKIDPGELCDTGISAGATGACPPSCDDGDACTSDSLSGSGCQAACQHTNICPQSTCGNGKLDAGELCDPGIASAAAGACPKSCDDGNACTVDQLAGSGCQQSCKHTNTCAPSVCGNGKVEPGEWCDTAIPAGTVGACPQSCDDGDACTTDLIMGSACLAICTNSRTPGCGGSTTPLSATGSPCTTNAECMTGQCLPEYNGFKGGMCSRPCGGACPRPEGEVATACVLLMADFVNLGGYCYALCDRALSATGCRQGYRCVNRDTATGLAQEVCVPDTLPEPTPEPLDPEPGGGAVRGGCSASGSPDLGGALLVLLGLMVLLARTRRSTR